jgi:hypothetical protein
MKTKFFLFTFLLLVLISHSQNFSISLPSEIQNNAQIINPDNSRASHTLQDYIIDARIKDDGFFEITIKDMQGKNEKFDLKPLAFPIFKTKFINSLKKIVSESEGKTLSTSSVSELGVSTLFARLVTYNNTESERPTVAKITLRDDIPVKFKNSNDFVLNSSNVQEYLTDVKVELSFYEGFIEKIEVEGKFFNEKVRFSNLYSIGISSSQGIRDFFKHNLESFQKYTFDKSNNKITRDYLSTDADYMQINLSNIIDYDREVDVNANDISPEPIKLILDSEQNTTKLYKEESTKLFEAIVYSDFLGVFDEENPNGIIQTEIQKRFNLNTNRKQIQGKFKLLSLLFLPIIYSEGYGFFEYIDVKASLSKIEENNKYLNPGNLGNVSYFSPLNIFQHQSFSIGGNVNIMTLENQNKKINTFLNSGLEYGRSGLQITPDENLFLNTMTIPLELKMHFVPEKRYGFIASNKLIYYKIFDDNSINLQSIDKENNTLVDPENWLNRTELQFYVNTSKTGKLFVRYGFVTEFNNWDNNFSQFQFGYSFYLFQRNGKKK